MDATRRSALGRIALAVGAVPAVGAGRVLDPATASPAPPSPTASAAPSVRDLGAKGDGRTDDTAAIQHAIDAAAQQNLQSGGGGVVYFPPGTYTVLDPLQVPAHVYLVGESAVASRLNYAGVDRDVFVTVGEAGKIATFSGIRNLWLESNGKTQTSVLLHGPQEGSTIEGSAVTGSRKSVIEIDSDGIEGGSNKFTISRCWFWTIGDDAVAGVSIGPSSGPLSIRDTTMVGTNRTRDPAADSAGVVAQGSLITLDNVNVEHFESHSYLDRTQATITNVTGFFNRYGVKTSPESKNSAVYLSAAGFDQAEASVLDQGAGIRIDYCRSYWSDAYQADRREFRRNFWEVGSSNIYQSDQQQAVLGYTSPATGDSTRFKFSSYSEGQWRVGADLDEQGLLGSADSSFDGAHLRIGRYHLWVDGDGRLRMKEGAPSSASDGDVVGSA